MERIEKGVKVKKEMKGGWFKVVAKNSMGKEGKF